MMVEKKPEAKTWSATRAKPRVLVCGSRTWTDREAIRKILQSLPRGTTIVEGGARGADTLAREVARELGFPVEEFQAEWDKYEIAAGPIRNRQMLNTKPDLVLAFTNDLLSSKGTKDCVRQALKRGIPVEVFPASEANNTALLCLSRR